MHAGKHPSHAYIYLALALTHELNEVYACFGSGTFSFRWPGCITQTMTLLILILIFFSNLAFVT